MGRLAAVALLVAGALLGSGLGVAAAPVATSPQRPELPQACVAALGDQLQLREEQRDGNGNVVASAGSGSPPLAYQPDAEGRYTPVLLVHGFTAAAGFLTDGWPKTGTFDRPITLNAGPGEFRGLSRSLVGQLQAIRGAAVFELDYHDRNTEWVAGPDNAGSRVAKAIDCLHAGFGRPVVVAAHSMGGLATRWALTLADGAAERATRVSTVVTFGTPYTGSVLADAGAKLLASGAGAKVAGAIADIVEWYHKATRACDGKTDDECAVVRRLLGLVETPAAVAMRSNSDEMRNAKPWPSGVRVFALAGHIELQAVMCTVTICAGGPRLVIGDGAVLSDSATADAAEHRIITCSYQYDASLVGLWTAVQAVANSPCLHTNLMAEVTLTNEAVAEVADAVRASQPPQNAEASWLVGSWSGEVFQHNINRTYPVQLDYWGGPVGSIVGRVTYPTLDCGGDLRLESVSDGRVAVTELITWGTSRCVNVVPLDLVLVGENTVSYTFYEHDLPSGKVNGEATLRRIGEGSNDVPEIFRGFWHGEMIQPSSERSPYSMAVTIQGGPLNSKVGTVEYADISCRGDWILRHAEPLRLVVEESITYGSCLNGYLEVTPTGDGMYLTFSTRWDWSAPIAWATLRSG